MEFRFTAEDEAFRDEVVEFIESELPWNWRDQELDSEEPEDLKLVKQFKKKLADKGWLTRAWPKEYGGQEASHMQQLIFNEETAYRGVPVDDGGVSMVGPTIMMSGTEDQKQFFLPRISRGEIDWCQGYSEPDSGSDLASVQTRPLKTGTTSWSPAPRYGTGPIPAPTGCSCWCGPTRMHASIAASVFS